MRYEFVTYTKAIGIILMVLVHARLVCVRDFVSMFHMPLFFIMSGYCFNEKNLENGIDFFKKKVRGIYIPYIKWGLLFLAFHNLFVYLHIYDPEVEALGLMGGVFDTHAYILQFRRTLIMASIEGMLGGYWFLKELFWASLLFWCSLRLKPKRLKEVKYLLFVLIVELIICLIWDSFEVPVIGITKRTILSLVFITSGYIYKSTLERKEIRVISKLPIIIVILFCMCCVYSLSIIFPASMNSFDSYTALPLFISGLLGTFSIFLFFKRIYMNHSKLLTLIGDSTLQILTWHFLCFKIVSLFIAWYFCLDIKCIAEFPVIENYAIQGWWFAYFNLGLFLPILFVLTYKKVKHVRF